MTSSSFLKYISILLPKLPSFPSQRRNKIPQAFERAGYSKPRAGTISFSFLRFFQVLTSIGITGSPGIILSQSMIDPRKDRSRNLEVLTRKYFSIPHLSRFGWHLTPRVLNSWLKHLPVCLQWIRLVLVTPLSGKQHASSCYFVKPGTMSDVTNVCMQYKVSLWLSKMLLMMLKRLEEK